MGPWSDTGSPATTASLHLSCNAPAVCVDRQGFFYARYTGLQENDPEGVAFEYERSGLNRIGRRTIFAMLLIVAVAIVWNLTGSR